jgi:rRNA maturation RNase YbeY
MEKEGFALNFNNINLNFYYDSQLVPANELVNYKKWLQLSIQSVDWFVDIEKPFNINLSIVDDEEIIQINNEHRNKNQVTDVLSFPMQDSIRSGNYDSFMPEIELGDVLICKSVCEKQAIEFKLSFMEEFVHLFMHGFLHLYGYDHEIDEEEHELMFKLEAELVEKISVFKNEI